MRVIRLRHRLVLLFLAATLVPLAAILWTSSVLMSRSLAFVATSDVDALTLSLEQVAREHYRRARRQLEEDVRAGRAQPERRPASTEAGWPPELRQFWSSSESERFLLSEPGGDRLHYAVKSGNELLLYTASLGGVQMRDVTNRIRAARERADDLGQRNLPRGFTLALALASAFVWLSSLALVVYLSGRISRPIQRLTTGLAELAAGRLDTRIETAGRDEVGLATQAFNSTASRLQRNQDRLVYLTQVASWQMLARKMAHEVKNSLTPIRLTVEEIAARQGSAEPEFFDRAAAIVVGEVTSLERRVRAFSEFAAEPEMRPANLDLEAMVRERIQFLRGAHPGVRYEVEDCGGPAAAWADGDQLRGILTNLLENAAEAAGEGGTVLVVTGRTATEAVAEVHDSGPGLSAESRARLFEPSISFKKHGMGLGLAISRKNALLSGGDLSLIDGRLGGAGFRLTIPLSEHHNT